VDGLWAKGEGGGGKDRCFFFLFSVFSRTFGGPAIPNLEKKKALGILFRCQGGTFWGAGGRATPPAVRFQSKKRGREKKNRGGATFRKIKKNGGGHIYRGALKGPQKKRGRGGHQKKKKHKPGGRTGPIFLRELILI